MAASRQRSIACLRVAQAGPRPGRLAPKVRPTVSEGHTDIFRPTSQVNFFEYTVANQKMHSALFLTLESKVAGDISTVMSRSRGRR